ncbi:MAG: hypothetical protein DRG63_09015 [Deltaproteobacteria bacterium]|nr:MAG: hypothetical protein DRG63_09015 [Deltaproteobacteria bacterium]
MGFEPTTAGENHVLALTGLAWANQHLRSHTTGLGIAADSGHNLAEGLIFFLWLNYDPVGSLMRYSYLICLDPRQLTSFHIFDNC